VQAQVTQPASPTPAPPTTSPLTPTTPVPPVTQAPTVTPSFTAPPPATATPIPCDRVKFISDISIPDDTQVDPGQSFIKTWRLQNAGSCTWNSAYTLAVDGENVFSAPLTTPFTSGTVPPGGSIDISITLTAPLLAGTYRGNFRLANPGGQKFGLGDGSKPFWAQVKVVVPAGIVLDFLNNASQAEWRSGQLNNLNTLITFGGNDDDPNGVAKIKDGVILETGATSGKILLTVPRHEANGVIAGTYPAFLVQAGDHLRARVGFIATGPGGTCGAGHVIFQVGYLEAGISHSLGEWPEICDGQLSPVNVDLSGLKGKTIQIILMVKAAGPVLDDWAIWNSPRIER
jgi:hypothetical protein